MNKPKHIVRQLSLFYKNNLPEGFGVTLDEEFFQNNPKAGSAFEEMSQCSINEYKKLKSEIERKEFIADIHSQLADACKWHHANKGTTTMDDKFFEAFNIALDDMTFLQSIGEFPNDDFNGPMWCYEHIKSLPPDQLIN